MRIVGLTMECADLEAQGEFWAETLGMDVARSGSEVEVRLRSSTIRFRRAAPGTGPRHHFAINVPPGSIERAAAWVDARHELLAFRGDPDEEEGATIVHAGRGTPAVYFLDAAGNVVELIASTFLDEAGGEEAGFGPQSLIDLAEMGDDSAAPAGTR